VVGTLSRKKVVKTPQNTPLLVRSIHHKLYPQCPLPLAEPSILSRACLQGTRYLYTPNAPDTVTLVLYRSGSSYYYTFPY
jgi:hypothetical protein